MPPLDSVHVVAEADEVLDHEVDEAEEVVDQDVTAVESVLAQMLPQFHSKPLSKSESP